MTGQFGCHIWPAMLTQGDLSNPTQIRQIGGVCAYLQGRYFYDIILHYEENSSKFIFINDAKLLYNFNDLRSEMLFVSNI